MIRLLISFLDLCAMYWILNTRSGTTLRRKFRLLPRLEVMTIPAEFVLARIAEDEAAAAHAAVESYDPTWEWDGNPIGGVGPPPMRMAVDLLNDVGAHVARWDPAHVLADCEAKRKLVQLAQHISDNAWQDGDQRAVSEFRASQILRFLALPYSEHPDYPSDTDPDWKS